MTLGKKPFENIVGKGENAGNQHFLLFPQCFVPFKNQISSFWSHLFCCLLTLILLSANVFNLDQSKILSFGKEIIGCLEMLCIWTSPGFCSQAWQKVKTKTRNTYLVYRYISSMSGIPFLVFFFQSK